MKGKTDEVDWGLICILKENSRKPNVIIAKELGVSEGMIRKRIARLKKEGIITRFTIDTSSKGLKAFIEVNVEVNVHTSEIATRIKELDGVEKVFETSGLTDIMVLVDVESTPQLNDVIESIRSIGPITNTRTKLVLSEI